MFCPIVKSKSDCYEPIHGDVLITKHSNLISSTGDGINVIFQVVIDENYESNNNIRIPSSLHNAISAVLRTCFEYDITTLSLRLLLVSSVSEVRCVCFVSRHSSDFLLQSVTFYI